MQREAAVLHLLIDHLPSRQASLQAEGCRTFGLDLRSMAWALFAAAAHHSLVARDGTDHGTSCEAEDARPIMASLHVTT